MSTIPRRYEPVLFEFYETDLGGLDDSVLDNPTIHLSGPRAYAFMVHLVNHFLREHLRLGYWRAESRVLGTQYRAQVIPMPIWPVQIQGKTAAPETCLTVQGYWIRWTCERGFDLKIQTQTTTVQQFLSRASQMESKEPQTWVSGYKPKEVPGGDR